jgi:DNA-binding HxlR family transcriptional regulator
MARRIVPFVCGIDAAIDVVGGKWKVLILWELTGGAVRRYAEIRDGLPGVTEKVLTDQLRELERDGVITRIVHPEVPPRVEYRTTEAGQELDDALRALGAWGKRHKARLEEIRAVS